MARDTEKQEAERQADGRGRRRPKEQLIEFFERTIWPSFPSEALGKTLDKHERERILGYGPHGV